MEMHISTLSITSGCIWCHTVSTGDGIMSDVRNIGRMSDVRCWWTSSDQGIEAGTQETGTKYPTMAGGALPLLLQ